MPVCSNCNTTLGADLQRHHDQVLPVSSASTPSLTALRRTGPPSSLAATPQAPAAARMRCQGRLLCVCAPQACVAHCHALARSRQKPSWAMAHITTGQASRCAARPAAGTIHSRWC